MGCFGEDSPLEQREVKKVKTLSPKESYEQLVRALKRLKVKELYYGATYVCTNGGTWPSEYADDNSCGVCAIGAANTHAREKGKIKKLSANLSGDFDSWGETPPMRWHYPAKVVTRIAKTNDTFLATDNRKAARVARYNHVLAWAEKQVAKLA